MSTLTCSLEHPIIFVFDYKNKDAIIPEHDPDLIVSANSSCASIRAICYVDGDITINLAEKSSDKPAALIKAFEGCVETPTKHLSVVNSENEKLLEREVEFELTTISIWIDEVEHPSLIFVEAW